MFNLEGGGGGGRERDFQGLLGARGGPDGILFKS